MPKGAADEQEEVILKGVLERVKNAYEAQQKQRRELEDAKSKLEFQKSYFQKIQSELGNTVREVEKLKDDTKDTNNMKEQLAELRERLATANEELYRRTEAMGVLRKEKMDMQMQCRKLEEKAERMTIENGLLNKKYNDALKEAEIAKNDYAQLKAEFGGIHEKNKILEEYQVKISLYEKQLKSKQEEIEITKNRISNMTGVIEAEEAKYSWRIKTREAEIQQLQETVKRNTEKIKELEEKLNLKNQLEFNLQMLETESKELRKENQRIMAEKKEMKKYAESLLSELKKKDTSSSYLVTTITTNRSIEE